MINSARRTIKISVDIKYLNDRTRPEASDGSGSKIFDPGWVGSAIYDLGLDLENFTIKFNFSLWIKKNIFGSGQ